MAINLDWTGAETRVLIQDQPVGQPIAGQDFYRALLRVWLGDKPVQDDLKKALLGGCWRITTSACRSRTRRRGPFASTIR